VAAEKILKEKKSMEIYEGARRHRQPRKNFSLWELETRGEIILSALTAFIGVYALACGIQGYMFRSTKIHERIMLFIAAVALIKPGWMTDLGGIILLAIVGLRQRPRIFIDLLHRVWQRAPAP